MFRRGGLGGDPSAAQAEGLSIKEARTRKAQQIGSRCPPLKSPLLPGTLRREHLELVSQIGEGFKKVNSRSRRRSLDTAVRLSGLVTGHNHAFRQRFCPNVPNGDTGQQAPSPGPSGSAFVLVDDAAQDVVANNLATVVRRGVGLGHSQMEASVGTGPVIVPDVLAKHRLELTT